MLLCRTLRLSAAARDQTFKFLVRVSANRPGDHVTLTAGHRASCGTAAGLDPSSSDLHLERRPLPWDTRCPYWGTRSGSVTLTDWAHWDRLSAVAASLGGGELGIIKRPLVQTNGRRQSRAEPPAVRVLFTLSSRRSSTMTVQTRASSTSAAAKRSDAGEEQTDAANKGDVPTLKEDSTTSFTKKGLEEDTEPEGGKPSKTQQLKKVFKEYGAVGVCFHIGISLMSLGMFYLLISSGIDMAAILCKVGFSETMVQSRMAAGTSTFVLAYAIHKLFAPVRISITLVSVPLIVRYFRKTGLFKPPTPAP